MEVRPQHRTDHLLQDEIRLDDAYLGGERTEGGYGSGSSNKITFVATVEMHDGRNG
jgi:hypothetical protein